MTPELGDAPVSERVSMLSLLREREFRTLAFTQFFSIVGDQLARVALTVLVFNRTHSALEAAVAYALGFLPAAIGGPLLSGLADRLPRRSVLISADLIRVPLIAAMAIPGLPIIAAMGLIAVTGLLEAPFDAARGALMPDVLVGERYPVGLAMGQVMSETARVGGFGMAGVLLIAISPSVLMLIDAATFVLSAALILRFVRPRPAAAADTGDETSAGWWNHIFQDARTSLDLVLRTAQLRSLVLLAWASALFVISFEGLGAPLARDSGSATWTVGVLLAAQPAGTVLGALLIPRIPPDRRLSAMRLLAMLSMLPLMTGLLRPPVELLVVVGLLSGIGISFNIIASTEFVAIVAPEMRGRALALVGTGLMAGQGLGMLAAGALATWLGARIALGWVGTVGTVATLIALWDGARARRMADSG